MNPSAKKLKTVERRLAREIYERALSRADGVVFNVRDVVDIRRDPLEPVLNAASDRVRGEKPKEQEGRFQWSTGRRKG